MRKAAILAGQRRVAEAMVVARRALHASADQDEKVFMTLFMETISDMGMSMSCFFLFVG